jgi:hypothetical protein
LPAAAYTVLNIADRLVNDQAATHPQPHAVADELRPHDFTLLRRAITRESTDAGLRFTLPADALPAVAAVINAERRCCRFLEFQIAVAANEGPVILTLNGPAGTREFLEALLDA